MNPAHCARHHIGSSEFSTYFSEGTNRFTMTKNDTVIPHSHMICPGWYPHTQGCKPEKHSAKSLIKRFLIGHVPYLCNHLGACQYSFTPAPHVPPSAPRGSEGKGEGRQTCFAAPTLNPLQHCFSVSRRRWCFLPTFGAAITVFKCQIAASTCISSS